jgi:cell division protein ZapE
MQWVHRRQFQLMGTPAPLLVLARELAQEIRVLCFDELFVADIADAMLLGTLFQALFTHGVTIVATSNQPPQQLYADGFNRERFMPAIRAIEKHMTIIAVDGGQDHRLHGGRHVQRYFVKSSQNNADFFTQIKTLSGTDSPSSNAIVVGSRSIECIAHTDKVLWCSYEQLCKAPLAAPDFIGVCDRFEVILLGDVPALGGEQQAGRIARGTEDGVVQVHAGDRVLPALAPNDDSVRRFIALVDECYDRGIPLYIEADVPLDALYESGYLEFPFRRAISRLSEMQFERYGLKKQGGQSAE